MNYGERVLFDDVSHGRPARQDRPRRLERVGEIHPVEDHGGARRSSVRQDQQGRYVTVGYLPRTASSPAGKPSSGGRDGVRGRGGSAGRDAEAQERLSTLDHKSEEYADTLEVFGELQHKLEDMDAFRMQSKVERVLMGLGFAVKDFERDCDEFSGGWQMRIALAKLLLREPSLLLLDEPTNHLDLDSLRWFEEYLRATTARVILVSHDRAFLDNLTKKPSPSMGTSACTPATFRITRRNGNCARSRRRTR